MSCAPELVLYIHLNWFPPRIGNVQWLLPNLLVRKPFLPRETGHGVDSPPEDSFLYSLLRLFLRGSFYHHSIDVQPHQKQLFPIEYREGWPCSPLPTNWKILLQCFLQWLFLSRFARLVGLAFHWDSW